MAPVGPDVTELVKLRKQRSSQKGWITRKKTNLEQLMRADDESRDSAKISLRSLRKRFEKYKKIQSDIEAHLEEKDSPEIERERNYISTVQNFLDDPNSYVHKEPHRFPSSSSFVAFHGGKRNRYFFSPTGSDNSRKPNWVGPAKLDRTTQESELEIIVDELEDFVLKMYADYTKRASAEDLEGVGKCGATDCLGIKIGKTYMTREVNEEDPRRWVDHTKRDVDEKIGDKLLTTVACLDASVQPKVYGYSAISQFMALQIEDKLTQRLKEEFKEFQRDLKVVDNRGPTGSLSLKQDNVVCMVYVVWKKKNQQFLKRFLPLSPRKRRINELKQFIRAMIKKNEEDKNIEEE